MEEKPVIEEWTTIAVTKKMANLIAACGKKGDKYNDILERLIGDKGEIENETKGHKEGN